MDRQRRITSLHSARLSAADCLTHLRRLELSSTRPRVRLSLSLPSCSAVGAHACPSPDLAQACTSTLRLCATRSNLAQPSYSPSRPRALRVSLSFQRQHTAAPRTATVPVCVYAVWPSTVCVLLCSTLSAFRTPLKIPIRRRLTVSAVSRPRRPLTPSVGVSLSLARPYRGVATFTCSTEPSTSNIVGHLTLVAPHSIDLSPRR